MVKISWTRQAIEDIHSIREYYLPISIKYTENLTGDFFEKVEVLEAHPKIGRVVPKLNKKDFRELIFKKYRIIYRIISETRIDIITIHHSARPLSEDSVFS